jgi:hypothetical protein
MIFCAAALLAAAMLAAVEAALLVAEDAEDETAEVAMIYV